MKILELNKMAFEVFVMVIATKNHTNILSFCLSVRFPNRFVGLLKMVVRVKSVF
jgi:hypothetical protein